MLHFVIVFLTLIIVQQCFLKFNPKNNHSQTRAMSNQLGRNVLCVEVVYTRLLYSYNCEVKVFYELHLQAFYFFQKKKN